MSKIIDADFLKQVVRKKFEQTQTVIGFMQTIDGMPAVEDVEKVEHGVWLYTEAEGGLKYWLCSNCRKAWWRKPPHDMKRCYNCGSYNKMQA